MPIDTKIQKNARNPTFHIRLLRIFYYLESTPLGVPYTHFLGQNPATKPPRRPRRGVGAGLEGGPVRGPKTTFSGNVRNRFPGPRGPGGYGGPREAHGALGPMGPYWARPWAPWGPMGPLCGAAVAAPLCGAVAQPSSLLQ